MNRDESNREVEVPIAPKRLPRRLRRAADAATPPAPRIPRITRLMALAIKFEDLIRRGKVRDYADLARLGHVSRARITQIMNLLNLAPEIEEELLNFSVTIKNNAAPAESQVRRLTGLTYWPDQQHEWRGLGSRARPQSAP